MSTSTESNEVKIEAQPQNMDKPMTEAERAEAIKRQVEYYLSRQNLLQDSFLLSKMDKDHYVELSVIAEFKMVKQLTTQIDVIISSIAGSDKIALDASKTKVKPLAIKERTTLILRNIPTSADEEAVKSLLKSVNVPEFLSIRSDVGDNWFVTFGTEETTKAALECAKAMKWEGKQVGCAIKSESMLKGLTMVPIKADQFNGVSSFSVNSGENGVYAGDRKPFRVWSGPSNGRRAPTSAEFQDSTSKRAPLIKKKQPRRDIAAKEGSSAESRSVSGRKEAVQAALNLSDFPVLGSLGVAASQTSSAEAISAATTPPLCTTPPLSDGPSTPSGAADAVSPKNVKISYAQIATASVANNLNSAVAKSA